MRKFLFGIFFGVLAVALSGCGGSSPGGSAAPTVSLLSRAPTGAINATASGFDGSGVPIYAVVFAGEPTKWTVYATKDTPLYDIPVGDVADSRPEAISGGYVAGTYNKGGEFGIFVGHRNDDASISAVKYPGYQFGDRFVLCDAGRAIVTANSGVSYSVMDLATGIVTAEAFPSGFTPAFFKGKFILCYPPEATAKSLVYNVDTNSSVELEAAADTDGIVSPIALNTNGQVLGVTKHGDFRQVRLWSPAGIPGEVLDTSISGGSIFIGWLSPDASKMTYKKGTLSTEQQFIRVNGVNYDVTKASLPYTSLNHLNDSGTIGFAADLSAGESPVAVNITY